MKPLVLLHGWGMCPTVFSDLATRLAPDYCVHAVPLPGYDNAPACVPYTVDAMAHAVSGSAPARCLVAGWSLGAQVALEWARTVPEQVERLVLMGATPCFARRDDWTAAMDPALLRGFATALGCDREGTLKRFVSLQAQGDRKPKKVARALRACVATERVADVGVLERGLEALLNCDLRGDLRAITQDVLVIHGECDALVPPAAGDYLVRTLPHARVMRIPGAAHAPFITDPAAVAESMAAFFA